MSQDNVGLLNLLKKVMDAQDERILAYKQFDSSFKAFKANPNDKMEILKYNRVVENTTTDFQEISLTIRQAQKELKELGDEKYIGLIDQLQNLEREKLQITINIQKVEQFVEEEKKKLACDHDETCRHNHQDEEELGGAKLTLLMEDLKKFKVRESELIEEINEILEEFRCDILELKSSL